MLTSAELEQFDRDGYLVFPGLLGEEKRQKYVAAFDELVERAKSWRPILRQPGRWNEIPRASRLPGFCTRCRAYAWSIFGHCSWPRNRR